MHVPKAAGTSINKSIYGRTLGHFRAGDIRRRFPQLYRQSFVFSVVRNPWDRLFSAYRFAVLGRTESMGIAHAERYRTPEFESFERFVLEWLPNQDLSTVDPVFQPQCPYLTDGSGDVIVDHVARFESLEKDLDQVRSATSLPIRLEQFNRSTNGLDYRRAYKTAEMVEQVCRAYPTDIDKFDYSFEFQRELK